MGHRIEDANAPTPPNPVVDATILRMINSGLCRTKFSVRRLRSLLARGLLVETAFGRLKLTEEGRVLARTTPIAIGTAPRRSRRSGPPCAPPRI